MTTHDVTGELPPVWQVAGYTHQRQLGTGATGLVMLAVHDETGTPVAIKYLSPELAGDPTFRADFRGEAALLAEVEDPHVSRLYEYVESPAGAAIVMELVDGVSLRELLRRAGPTDPQTALFVLKGSLLGLAAAHQRGVVHRDYKPENVLVTPDGQSKLADFGIAGRAGEEVELSGTPGYMAPEQWHGASATPATDIYAATATFYECLTGRQPYTGHGDITILQRQHEFAEIPTEGAPPSVQGLLRHGLAKQPQERPRSAAEFLVLLESVALAAFGANWEEEGRSKLAERVAMLLFLLPTHGIAVESVMATNRFGGLRRGVLIGSAALLVFIGGVGVSLAGGGGDNTIDTLPTPTVSITVTPTATTSPTATASPKATPTKTKSKSPPPPKTVEPTPATSTSQPPQYPPNVQVLAISGEPRWEPTSCTRKSIETPISIRANGTGKVTFTFSYRVGREITTKTMTFDIDAGPSTKSYKLTGVVDLTDLPALGNGETVGIHIEVIPGNAQGANASITTPKICILG